MALTLFQAALLAQATEPEPLRTSITVVDRITAETPASITSLDRSEVQTIPGVNLDDRLRNIPGFSLFRRSSSLVAHPTTQGISLRGIGSSGASRSLVLWDGLPMNDPFGGWVYWTRIPPEQIDRIEISRGASTSVFGDRAMGGAIALFTRPPEARRVNASYEGGRLNTHDAAVGYSDLWTRVGVSAYARAFTTDGFYIVQEPFRGAIDRPAALRFVAGNAKADWFRTADRFYLKTDILAEDRKNGTVLQNNSTSLGSVAAHYQRDWTRDTVSLIGFHSRQEFRSAFSAILENRDAERLTMTQRVPADATGGSVFWRRGTTNWNTVAGADIFRVEGHSIETLVPAGQRAGGGTLLQHGTFLQADASAGPARVFLGARHHFTGQDRQFFSPSGGVVVGRGIFRARGAVYRSFRAPTLNELYREFRAGNAVTQANPELRPERLFGAEAGVDVVGEHATLRITGYRNALDDLITNVTLSVSPNLIVRQRRNAATALSRGFEVDGSTRWRMFRAEARYLFVDSTFGTGEMVPQIPRHQGSGDFVLDWRGTLASIGMRRYGYQFEDDRNLFLLPAFNTVQLVVRQRVARHLAAVAAVENLFDREYLTGFSPTPTTGTPRLWRVGLRWDGRLH